MKEKRKKNIQRFEETGKKNEDFFHFPDVESLIKNNQELLPDRVIGPAIINKKVAKDNRFSLSVENNEMAHSGIEEGDFVVVQRETTFYEGDIVALRTGGKTFIRRLFHSKKRLELKSDDEMKTAIIIDKDTPGFEILGRVIQVIKEIK